jgi:hypothetical protein
MVAAIRIPDKIRHVNLGTGDISHSEPQEVSSEDGRLCLSTYAAAQTDWVPVPAITGFATPAFTMTSRVYLPEGNPPDTPTAAVVLIQDADEIPVITLGLARESKGASKGGVMWRVLIQTADLELQPLEYPQPPFVALRPEIGMAKHVASLAWLATFERTLAWEWLRYMAYLDHSRSVATQP